MEYHEIDTLLKTFAVNPSYSVILTSKDLDKVILYSDGKIFSQGHLREVKYKKCSPSLYRVWLQIQEI